MTIVHHLDEATIVRYAAGDLDEAFAVIVAAHIAVCDECRRGVRTAEALGAHMLEQCEPAAIAPDAFERLAQRLDAHAPDTVPRAPGADALPLRGRAAAARPAYRSLA